MRVVMMLFMLEAEKDNDEEGAVGGCLRKEANLGLEFCLSWRGNLHLNK